LNPVQARAAAGAIKEIPADGGRIDVTQIEADVKKKLTSLLKELFQFDTQDLDFGIYRIMNLKRKEIERFIEEELFEAAEAEFRKLAGISATNLQKEIERLKAEIIRDFGEGTIDDQGEVRKNEDAPKVREYIKKKDEVQNVQVTQEQINDVFNCVYEFFSRYYEKGDFLSKRRFGGKEKYYVPYNGEEVVLHWANRDQYYIKSGEYFRNYSFKAGSYRVNFVLRKAENESNNVKGEPRYFLLDDVEILKLDEKKKGLDIYFNWRSLTNEEKKRFGERNIQEVLTSDAVSKLLSKIAEGGLVKELCRKADEEETLIEKHLSIFVRKNTADYFVHKNLGAFLKQELDFFLKNEVLDIGEIQNADNRFLQFTQARISAIKGIGTKIVEFLAQIEDFERMLFEKKKLVLRTDYCMTLDLVPEQFYEQIGRNEKQIAEWKKMFKLDETTEGVLDKDDTTAGRTTLEAGFLKRHKNLVLDTGLFAQDFKDRLLCHFDEIDKVITGILIKSENFQALNLLLSKYSDRIKCIYIDPPYNTGSDGFCYKDNYQHSSWISMMENRLELANRLLRKQGAVFISNDDNEVHHLRSLMNTIFKGGFKNTIIFRRGIKSVQAQFETVDSLTVGHEYVLMFAKSPEARFKKLTSSTDEKMQGSWNNHWRGTDRPTMRYKLFGITPKTGQWRWSQERSLGAISSYKRLLKQVNVGEKDVTQEMIDKWYLNECEKTGQETDLLRLSPKTGKPEHYIPPAATKLGSDLWIDITTRGTTELEQLFGEKTFDNPKPVPLVQRILQFMTEDDDIVLDFFAGSGTTAEAVLKQNSENHSNLKYILVEMEDYFETVLLPRIKRVMYSEDWKDGLPLSKRGHSHMLKYMYLEQYEDSLNNIVIKAFDKTVQETLDDYRDYFLRYMLEYATRESPTRLSLSKFQTPFDYRIRIAQTDQIVDETVDLIETFNYLLGLSIQQLRVFRDGERIYRVVLGKLDNETTVIVWRNTKSLDLERDKNFIEKTVIAGQSYDRIFVNGDSYVKNAQPIEPEFKKLMGA
jgi:adenine-specific DNA-methyltransferase